jgi:hypothetical protein
MSACEACAERYRKNVQYVVKIPAQLAKPGLLPFMTLTGPGERVHCLSRGCSRTDCRHRKCPCTPYGQELDSRRRIAEWNGRQGLRWNRFWQGFERLLATRGVSAAYFRAVEVQERGVLHEHLVLIVDRPLLVDVKLRAAVRKLAIAHGYGHQLDLRVAEPKVEAHGMGDRTPRLLAWYVSKYVSKSVDERPNVPWRRWDQGNDVELVEVYEPTGEILSHEPIRRGSPRSYRTWTCSQDWGCSLGLVKRAQREWWRVMTEAQQQDWMLANAGERDACVLALSGCQDPGPPPPE